MLTGEPKDALHQLRTRVCSLLFIVRGYCAPEIGIRDGAGARGRITHQCEPASVPGLGNNEPENQTLVTLVGDPCFHPCP